MRMSEFALRIDGMHCGSCVRRVSQALSQTAGVTVKEVQIGAARLESEARLGSEEQTGTVDAAIAALAKAGYTARPDPSDAAATAGN
jgi:copper chaperone